MKVFKSNNPDAVAIQRDDEEFFAESGRQYQVRHPHQTEIDLFAQQGGKMRNPWPVAIVKRLSATRHELIVLSMTDDYPSGGSPVRTLQHSPDKVAKCIFNLDQEACATALAATGFSGNRGGSSH